GRSAGGPLDPGRRPAATRAGRPSWTVRDEYPRGTDAGLHRLPGRPLLNGIRPVRRRAGADVVDQLLLPARADGLRFNPCVNDCRLASSLVSAASIQICA